MSPTPPQQPSTPMNSGSQKRHRGSGQSSPATPTHELRVAKQRPRRGVTSPNSSRGHNDNHTSDGGHDDGGDGGQRQSDTSARRQATPLTCRPRPPSPPKSDPAATSAASLAVPGGEGNPSCTRAENHQRSVSVPATRPIPQNPTSEPAIHTEIAGFLDDGIPKGTAAAKGQSFFAKAKAAVGYNYIFATQRADASSSSHVIYKVGSCRNPKERANQLKRTCGFARVEKVTNSELPPIRLYKMAEKLMHAELAIHRYHGPCRCGKDHHEFYRVDDVERLLACQRRWYAFCKSEPFGGDLKLQPRWKQRLAAMEKQGVAAGCGYGGIAKAWNDFVYPTRGEKLTADARMLGEVLRLGRWQLGTFTGAVIFYLRSSSPRVSLLWLLFVVFWLIDDTVRPRESWFFTCPRRPSPEATPWRAKEADLSAETGTRRDRIANKVRAMGVWVKKGLEHLSLLVIVGKTDPSAKMPGAWQESDGDGEERLHSEMTMLATAPLVVTS